MKFSIYTNNPLVWERLSGRCTVNYQAGSYRALLVRVRDAIHGGGRLLSHPLSGSVKPGETVYKSVALTEAGAGLDFDSLTLIENSIVTCDKFPLKYENLPPEILNDFSLVDLALIEGCLSQMEGAGPF